LVLPHGGVHRRVVLCVHTEVGPTCLLLAPNIL
jgi:hypothetical protein